MDLAFDDHWVQHDANIVDCRIRDEIHFAGIWIYFDLGDMAAARKAAQHGPSAW